VMPTTAPPTVAAAKADAKTRLSANMNGYAASTKVPKKKLIEAPEAARARSPDERGRTILARVMPRLTITSEVMSIAPKKLCPFSLISTSTRGRITEW